MGARRRRPGLLHGVRAERLRARNRRLPLRAHALMRLPAVLTLALALGAGTPLCAQTKEDTRTQYPAALANSYFSFNVGAVDYRFSPKQLEPGFTTASVDTPHLNVRVALFGHQFTKYLSVQGSYMRPVAYITYNNVNGATDHHHVRVNFGSVTIKSQVPVRGRVAVYGEGGLGFTSRTGFQINGTPAV